MLSASATKKYQKMHNILVASCSIDPESLLGSDVMKSQLPTFAHSRNGVIPALVDRFNHKGPRPQGTRSSFY